MFWRAARIASDPLLYDAAHLNAGKTFQNGAIPTPFVYPPTFLLLAYPFGFLTFARGYLLWVGLSCAALTAAASRLVNPVWAAAVLPLSLPVMVTAAYGQSTLFVAAALILGVTLAEQGAAAAGLFFAVAICIKPQVVLLSPILLIGRWRAFAVFVLSGIALVSASCAFGAAHWLQWPGTVLTFEVAWSTSCLPLGFVNPSRLASDPWAEVLIAGVGIAFAVWSARGDVASRIVGVVAGSLCCTPYATRNDIALLAPAALFWLLQPASFGGWIRRGAGAAVLLGFVAGPLSLVGFMGVKLVADAPDIRRVFRKGGRLWPRHPLNLGFPSAPGSADVARAVPAPTRGSPRRVVNLAG